MMDNRFTANLMGRLFTSILLVYSLILLFWSFHLKDPHLLAFRSYELPSFFALCLIGLISFWYVRRNLWRNIGICLITTAIAASLLFSLQYNNYKNLVLNGDIEVTHLLGRHFVVGYRNIDELRPLIENGLITGVFVTKRNAEGKTFEQMREEIDELQRIRSKIGFAKLIIATDQEGGIVSRMSPPLVHRPSLGELAAKSLSRPVLLEQVKAYGREQGKELSDLGVTVNLSPVVDLQSATETSVLDFHSFIKQRAISSSPTLTTEVAQAYVQGLESQRVNGTLKHFPGLGGVATDTHHFSATLKTSEEQLASRDWLPFRQTARNSKALIMLGHVILSAIDQENPVSCSKTVIQKIIRGSWQHEGVLITDDLTMAAAFNRGLCAVTVKALNAGVDLLLVSYDYERFYQAMHCAIAAYERGELSDDELTRSDRRLRQITAE